MDKVKEFKGYRFEEGKSLKTIESYIGDVAGFLKCLKSIGVRFQGELKRAHITRYRSYLIDSGYENATTIRK